MKNITLFLFLLITFSFFAQSPEKMSYQAVIRDATNTLVTNQSVGMQISILQTTTTGTAIYTETQTVSTNTNGLLSLEIGMGVTSDDFSAIDWNAGPYFIKTETDPTGGTSYTITGTSQLMSVPFAMYSKTSGDGITVEQSDAIIENTGKVSMVLGTTAKTALAGDTSTISSDQTDAIEANTAKEGYTEAAVSNNTAVAANTLKVGITAQQASDITSNTAKTGITSNQATAITDNTAKLGYTEAAATAITAVAVNTLKVGITAQQASDITSNNAKTVITTEQSDAIAANTAKTGITSDQATAITDNTAKVGYTEAAVTANTAVAVNTLKVGITAQQASDITSNNAKTVITTVQSDAIVANTAKTGITSDQATAIKDNTTKVGYTDALVSANTDVAANTTKVGMPEGTAIGQMNYWNGSTWLTIDVGINGSVLVLVSGVPTWSTIGLNAGSPTITSGATGNNLEENTNAGQTVYTITANDDGDTISSYAIAGTDAALLSVNASSGVVTLTADPDYENKSSYSFTVTATDEAGTSSATTVTFSIINVNDTVPSITSGAAGTDLVENSGAGQTVYTITADANDGGTISSYAIAGTDAGLLSVNSSTGVVTLTADPNYELKNSYSFTVTAADAAGTSAPTDVIFYITNVDEVAPTITSGTTATPLEENSGSNQTVYTITADANDGGTISSYAIAGTDVETGLLSVTAAGVVTLTADPNYESKNSYSFTVTAADAAGTSAATKVTFSITNVDEVAPMITSGTSGTDLAENSGAGQTIYFITAINNDDGVHTNLHMDGTDAGLLSFNGRTGAVTLTADPDYETKNSYSFTVFATDHVGASAATTVTFSITNMNDTVPTITSGTAGTDLVENSGAGQTVYTITAAANDGGTISSYAIGGMDADYLSLDQSTGAVSLQLNPDFEDKHDYSFTVTATDEAGTSAATTVTFSITNVNDVVPTITSGTTGTNLVENSGAGQTVYTITADANYGGTISSYAIAGTDVNLLSVNSSTGVVKLTADPDFEDKHDYSFTVTAKDAAGTSAASDVTFSITNVDDVVPTITSGSTGTNLAENSGAGQTVYTITADANDGGTIFSYAIVGTDAALLTLTGNVVSLTADPDYETKSSYSFTVTAKDAAGTSAVTTVTFSITNLGEVPTITSYNKSGPFPENMGAGRAIKVIRADANDGGTISSYAIGGTDAGLLTLTGHVVYLTANPDYETKSSYSFTVTATNAAGTSAAQTVTFSITNVDDTVPTITSGSKGTDLADCRGVRPCPGGTGQTVYTITADANDGGTISSYEIAGTDARYLTLTGNVVSLNENPYSAQQSSFSFTVTASDATGTSDPTTVTFNISKLPTTTSGAKGINLVESSGVNQIVYTITADANSGGTISSYAILYNDFITGTDINLLSVDSSTGIVRLIANPDYDTKSSYSLLVTAKDNFGNTSPARTVTFNIIPWFTITSGTTGINLVENSGAGQPVYTITADANDGGTTSSYEIAGTDAGLLSVNSSTGVVSLNENPDYETKSSYSFTVTAKGAGGADMGIDAMEIAAGKSGETKTVTFAITNADEVNPTITSGTTGINLVENSGAGQPVYTIKADANDGGTISSYAIDGTDAGLLTLTGRVVHLTANPDYETKASYSFTVTASDTTGTSDPKPVSLIITNGLEITSGDKGIDLEENSGAGQTVYSITTDASDLGVDITRYYIGTGGDGALFSVTDGGVVSLKANPIRPGTNHFGYSFRVGLFINIYTPIVWQDVSLKILDVTPPVVTVISAIDIVAEGSSWTDPGATRDQGPIFTSGTVNTSIPGLYTITYTATDLSGNTATATRIVTVIPKITTLNYSGSVQTFTVPAGVTSISVDAYGASSSVSSGIYAGYCGGYQAKGGRVQTDLSVSPGETLYVYVGGMSVNCYNGSNNCMPGAGTNSGQPGGWNGGGKGSGTSQAGGGATDIRSGGQSLEDRIIVAGGAGGAGVSCKSNGGHGGGLIANDGGYDNSGSGSAKRGRGGSQTSGGLGGSGHNGSPKAGNGAFGVGGNGDDASVGNHGGGGGGGWYGGGGAVDNDGGGGGGSSYTHPNRCSTVVFDFLVHTKGVQTGHGKLIVTLNSAE